MHARLLFALSLTLLGCGGSSNATDSGPTNDAFVATDAGNTVDAAMPIDMGSTPTDSGEMTYTMPAGDCFTFATATSMDAMSMTCGDMQGLSGANVDLSSGGAGAFCQQTGSYTSLTSIPSDYTSCAWMSYVEGIVGLANTGFIVRDAAGVHHYRMHVIDNTQPALVFSFDMID